MDDRQTRLATSRSGYAAHGGGGLRRDQQEKQDKEGKQSHFTGDLTRTLCGPNREESGKNLRHKRPDGRRVKRKEG